MKSSKLIALFIALAACLWIGSGFLTASSKEMSPEAASGQTKAEKKLQKVRVRIAQASAFKDEVDVTGRTQASREVEIKAEIAGEISEVLKEEGQSVTADETIAKMELRDRKARETEAKGRVEQRRIEYNAAKKLAGKGFNSKVRLAQALADLEGAKAALKQAQIDLYKTDINAPFDGMIFQQGVDAGDYVSVGENMFSIVDLDPIEIVAFVSERKIQDITLGQTASAEFLNGQKIEGTISYIAPAADDQTRTFRIIMSAPNAQAKIRDGLTTKIRIPVTDKQAHKISPSILTLNTEGQIGVKIVNDQDQVEFVPVKILADRQDAMWISGPPDNARFITVGAEFVVQGQTVEPVAAEGEGLL